MANGSTRNTRAAVSGVIASALLIFIAAIAVWLSSEAESAFGIAFTIILVAVLLAIIAGYFTAENSSIIGFATRWKADLEILFPPPDDEDDLLRDTRRTRNAFLAVALLGAAAILVFSLQWKPAGFAQVFGSALMIALAALAAGIFLGFLFAIPRTLQESRPVVPPPPPPPLGSMTGSATPPSAPAAPPAAATVQNTPFGINTNLEQISDWLTKIIVGLGLINLNKIPAKTRSFISQIAPSVGNEYGFALAVVAGYSMCGFMLGYLLTRLYLARAFARAFAVSTQVQINTENIRREVERVGAETAATATVGGGSDVDPISTQEQVAAVRVERLAEKADSEHLRAQVEGLARDYESVRAAMLPGAARTKAMEVVASKMRTLGRACYELLPMLARSQSPGQRLAAISFLEVQPNRAYLPWLSERFSIEKPFLMYHSAWAFRHAARLLPVTDLDIVEQHVNMAIATMNEHPQPDVGALETLKGTLRDIERRRKTG